MRVNIIFSGTGSIPALAKAVADALGKHGSVVTLTQAEVNGSRPIPCSSYDLVILGCPTLGFLGGKLPDDLVATMPRCTRLDGRTAAAFVNSRLLGSTKSLKATMGLLEKQGAIVEDFAAIGAGSEIQDFVTRLVQLMERRRGA